MIPSVATSLLACLLLFGMAPPAASAADTRPQAKEDKITKVPTGDPAMAVAYERAKSTLPAFKDSLTHPTATMARFAVKVGLPSPQGTEFVWLASPVLQDGKVRGVINNQIEYATDYRTGQRVEFPDTEVVDWMYMDADKMKGNFTLCAIVTKLTKQEQREFAQEYSIDCGPPK